MTDQFESQLTDYVKSIRSAYGYQATPWTFQHAGWTALAFGRVSYAEIARWNLSTAPNQAPANTVRMAVVRFAREISLTLPQRRKQM